MVKEESYILKIYNLKRLSKQILQHKEPAQQECHQEYGMN